MPSKVEYSVLLCPSCRPTSQIQIMLSSISVLLHPLPAGSSRLFVSRRDGALQRPINLEPESSWHNYYFQIEKWFACLPFSFSVKPWWLEAWPLLHSNWYIFRNEVSCTASLHIPFLYFSWVSRVFACIWRLSASLPVTLLVSGAHHQLRKVKPPALTCCAPNLFESYFAGNWLILFFWACRACPYWVPRG